MTMVDLFREAMAINTISEMDRRQAVAEAFFDKVNRFPIPETFNWASEVFAGVHVRERGDQPALVDRIAAR